MSDGNSSCARPSMSTAASPCMGAPGGPPEAICQHATFGAVKAHSIIWRANLNRAAAFCATAASTCLSGDGRILAFCDGSCVLTLDTAAAANAEASSPHRGALSSPVGLLRVADCPGVPAPMTDSLPAGSRERTGSRVGEVQNIVRRMLTATHSVPQYRRFHCICWLPPFALLESTHPTFGGFPGVARRCVAGLRDGGCRCLAVTTREGGVSLWIQKGKETPLPRSLALACDLGAVWRQHTGHRDARGGTPRPPYAYFWRIATTGRELEGALPTRCVPLSCSGDFGDFDEPLIAAPATSICVPFPQRGEEPHGHSKGDPGAASTPASGSSSSLLVGGLFSGTLVAVASQGLIPVFLISGSRLRHRSSSGNASSTSNGSISNTWRQETSAATENGSSVPDGSSTSRSMVPEGRGSGVGQIDAEDPLPLGPGGRPRRAATRCARAAITAALSAEGSSDPDATEQRPAVRTASRTPTRRANWRGRRAQKATPSSVKEAGMPASPSEKETESHAVEPPIEAVQGEPSFEGSPAPGRKRRILTGRGNDGADASAFSPSSPSFAASEDSSSSSSDTSLANSGSESPGDMSEEDEDEGRHRGQKRQGTQSNKAKRKQTTAAAGAGGCSGGMRAFSLTAEAEKQQQKWRRAADAADEAAAAERASAAAGLLQPLLVMVLAIPTPSRRSSNGSNEEADWAVPSPPLQGLITDVGVGNPSVRAAGAMTEHDEDTGNPLEGKKNARPSSAGTTKGEQQPTASSEGLALRCSFQVVAALSDGAVWSFDCSFRLSCARQQMQQRSPRGSGELGDRQQVLHCGMVFVVDEITAAAPQLLLPPAGIPSGFLQLAEVTDALMPMEEAIAPMASTDAATCRTPAERSPATLLQQGENEQQQQAGDLLSCWRIAGVVCGSRLRVALMRNSVSSAAGCSRDSLVAQQVVVARMEASLFFLGFQRGLEGPIVSLCILPVVPLDLAAAAVQQIPELQNGQRPFVMLLVSLHKGALLPFVLYPDYDIHILSRSSLNCRNVVSSWALKPLAPVTSINGTSRIEDLLMPRAIYSFKPLVSNASAVGLAQGAAVTASACDAFAMDAVNASAAMLNGSDRPAWDAVFSEDANQQLQQQQQQHGAVPKDSWGEEGDPSCSLCPPSVRARRAHSLLSRRLMALMPSPCGSLLFIVTQQNEVHVQLSVAPLDVSPASVALLSLESQMRSLLEGAEAARPFQMEGLLSPPPAKRRAGEGQRLSLDFSAAAALCCADAHGLWALRLALRGPFQRPANPDEAGKHIAVDGRSDNAAMPSRRRRSMETAAHERYSEDDEVSVASDVGREGPTTGTAALDRASAPPPPTVTGGDAFAPSNSLAGAAPLMPPGDLFRYQPEGQAPSKHPGGYHGVQGALREALREAWMVILQGESGAALQHDLGALWCALLETLEAAPLLRFASIASAATTANPAPALASGSLMTTYSSSGAVGVSAADPIRSVPCCKWIAAAIGQRRRVIVSLALRLCSLLTTAGAASLRREAALLLVQHLRALTACMLPADQSLAWGAYIKKPSPSSQRLLLLLAPASSGGEEQGRLSLSIGTLPDAGPSLGVGGEAGESSNRTSPAPQVVTAEEGELQNFLLSTVAVGAPCGIGAAGALRMGEALVPSCPLCRKGDCKSMKPFRSYVCQAYGHCFPACAQCLRCLYTGNEGHAGAPLPLGTGSASFPGDEGIETFHQESASGQHGLSFFSCTLCGAFVCGGELPETAAMEGCGWWPYDFAVARGGRCCPLCRGALRLASGASCCSRTN